MAYTEQLRGISASDTVRVIVGAFSFSHAQYQWYIRKAGGDAAFKVKTAVNVHHKVYAIIRLDSAALQPNHPRKHLCQTCNVGHVFSRALFRVI